SSPVERACETSQCAYRQPAAASAASTVRPDGCSAVRAGAPQPTRSPFANAAAAAAPRSTGSPLSVQATAPVARPVSALARIAASSAHLSYALGNADPRTRFARSVIRMVFQPLTFFRAE